MSGQVDFVDPLDLVDAERYARRGYPHEVWTRLRAEAPVAWIEPPGFEPFWAVTKRADIQYVASEPLLFSSAYGISLRKAGPPLPPVPPHTEILVAMDPPRHGPLRRVGIPAFRPRELRAQRPEIEAIAIDLLDQALADGADLDFVERVAAPLPLAVVARMLGAPRDDVQLLYRWTNEVIGKEDPEYRQPGETPGQTVKRARGEIRAYFKALLEDRRRTPQADLMSELLAADMAGTPLTEEQLISYCELLVEAGNETTRNAISGGLLAFAERPAEWQRLRAHLELMPDTVEEILRWVSPISHFSRIATQDVELHGQPIRAGEQVALYFASANRDEDVYDDPFEFRIDRRPNPHLAFGFGEHFCMGAHLARVEIDVLFRQLLARVESFEVAGPVERLSSIINGSLKHLPVAFRLADQA
jgi:cytochrome P450